MIDKIISKIEVEVKEEIFKMFFWGNRDIQSGNIQQAAENSRLKPGRKFMYLYMSV